jgi:flagellar biosynthetic protein FlhB
VTNNIDDLVTINRMDLGTAVHHAGNMILDACFWMSMGLLLIALADVPLQHYQTHKRLKMTRQEIKDSHPRFNHIFRRNLEHIKFADEFGTKG